VLGQKTKKPPNPYRFGGNPCIHHGHGHAFPANARLIFVTDELTHDRYLVDTGAPLSIVPCTSKTNPSGPLLKGADGQPIPSWGFVQKTVQFHGKLFSSQFLQAAVAGPILGIDFLRKFKATVAPETSQILFACTAVALSAPKSVLPSLTVLFHHLFHRHPAQLHLSLDRQIESLR
jgi:hypothetical protein